MNLFRFITTAVYASGDLREQLDGSTVAGNIFYEIFYKLLVILAGFYQLITHVGWMLLICFLTIALLFSGAIHNERDAGAYKNWAIRIIIGMIVLVFVPRIVGYLFEVGSMLGR